jgi:hypothetical protein
MSSGSVLLVCIGTTELRHRNNIGFSVPSYAGSHQLRNHSRFDRRLSNSIIRPSCAELVIQILSCYMEVCGVEHVLGFHFGDTTWYLCKGSTLKNNSTLSAA